MKRTFIVLISLLLLTNFSFAQKAIKKIREKYKVIKENYTKYDTTYIEMWDESTEGGHAIAYFDKSNKLKLVEATWFGESGKLRIEYYYDNDEPFFVFCQDFQYNRPVYWDENMAKESGDTEVHDPKKSKIEENRYYFVQNVLIRWIDPNKKQKKLTDPKTKSESKAVLKDGKEFKTKMYKKYSKKL